MTVADVMKKAHGEVALLIGNGINRFGAEQGKNSWEDLLLSLARKYAVTSQVSISQGISLTEFYDVLDLNRGDKKKHPSLQEEFCNLMEKWEPQAHHRLIVDWAQRNKTPILTTNFENNLGTAGRCDLLRISGAPFTDFYPWDSFYGTAKLSSPLEGFGIWHINGMERYPRSIRLGLTHYVAAAQRARTWLHHGRDSSLFAGKGRFRWSGRNTWLQIVFDRSLVIIGLELGTSEIFLRWLFIERAKYYSQFPERRKPAWYFCRDVDADKGKKFFLSNLGVQMVPVASYKDLYERPWT